MVQHIFFETLKPKLLPVERIFILTVSITLPPLTWSVFSMGLVATHRTIQYENMSISQYDLTQSISDRALHNIIKVVTFYETPNVKKASLEPTAMQHGRP